MWTDNHCHLPGGDPSLAGDLVREAAAGGVTRLINVGCDVAESRAAIEIARALDGVWATVGSTNLDWPSFSHNHELNAVVLGTEFGAQVQAMFEADLAASDAIQLQQWERRPLDVRLKEGFARLWEYWL